MTSIMFLEFFLFLSLLHQVHSEEAEPVFRAEGTAIEMGYCFGVDYIVVYRSAPQGDQLLGNSSAEDLAVTPPADLSGRISINKHLHLLGLQISNLTRMDSGIYRRECWQNQTLVSLHTHRLIVCNEEVEAAEIEAQEHDGGAALLCNTTSVGLEGTSVQWYREMYPSYKPTLFLDSSMSLEPLVEDLQGVMEVRNGGLLLWLDNSVLKNNQQFYCLVIKGKDCFSFQNLYLPDNSENREMFASQGDRVVLDCPSDGNDQLWETPQGTISGSTMKNTKMFISVGDKSEDFSLVIPEVSEEHDGEYSCVSSSLEIQYSLVLCPKNEIQTASAFKGGDVSLHCDAGETDTQRVQWYRLKQSGKQELIHDSSDKTVPIPESLRGRLTLSGSSLMISHLEVSDLGTFWCIVSAVNDTDTEEEYTDDYTDEIVDEAHVDVVDTEEGESTDDPYWPKTQRCIFKQETMVNLRDKTGEGVGIWPQTVNPLGNKAGTGTTADPSAAPNVTAIAAGCAVAGLVLLLVGVIAAVIVRKKAAKRDAGSGKDTTRGINLDADPGCTDSLTQNHENGA